MLLLLLGWTCLAGAGFWSLAVLGILMIPAVTGSTLDLLRKADGIPAVQHVSAVLCSAGGHLAQALLTLAFLPYEAYFSLDAILRTTWRIVVSKKRLMEWMPSDSTDHCSDGSLRASYRSMWIAPVAALASAGYLSATTPATLLIAGPILLLWIAAPALAWWIGRPLDHKSPPLAKEQIAFLQKISRKDLGFF